MKETAKRLFALMLVLTMVCSLLPVSALATEVGSENEETIVQSEYGYYINPLYKDVVTEADLNTPSGIMLLSGTASASAVTSPEKAGAALREAMVNRQASLDIAYHVDTYDKTAVLDLVEKIIGQALVHTGKPTEGDYLRFQYSGFTYGYSASIYSDGSADITLQYAMTYRTTAEQEAELDAAVSALLKELAPSGTDYEKLSTVYDYICENIVYDYTHLENTEYDLQYTAYAALINKTAVCQGYANLLYRLALEMGIDCRIISGTGNGGDHGWNIVKLGNQYYNVDATWDATWMQGVGHYKYFLVDEAAFTANGTDHIRDEEYETAAFHSAYPTSSAAYDPSADSGDSGESYVASGTCGENLTWILTEDGVLTVRGFGEMDSYWNGKQPWLDYREQIVSVVVETGVTGIGANAFYGCTALTSVEVAEGVNGIGADAFDSCTSLTEFEIPASVTSFGEMVFNGCTSMRKLTVAEGNAYYCTDEYSVLYSKDMTALVTALNTLSGEYTIPEGVTVIKNYAFWHCSGLTNVVLPETLTKISNSVFSYCTGLTEITIPEKVSSIGDNIFMDCTGLSKITFEGSAPTMSDRTFLTITATAYYPSDNATWTADVKRDYGGAITWVASGEELDTDFTCGNNLTWSYTDGVLTISGTGAMTNYESSDVRPWEDYIDAITKVVIEAGVTTIGTYAFKDAVNITSVTLPEGLETIGEYAFGLCSSITEIIIPESATFIGSYVFRGCSSLSEIIIPDNVTYVGSYAFHSCSGLTDITLGSGLTEIEQRVFQGCTSLTEIVIPETVTAIGSYAFYNCAGLKEIVVPRSVTTIGNYAFSNCTGLTKITFEGDVPSIASNTFKAVTATAYYPADNATWTSAVMQQYGGNITWVPYTPGEEVAGDLDGDGVVSDTDVAELLWYVLFPTTDMDQNAADVDGDEDVDLDDVIYLLWYTLFPDDYPL